MSSSSNPSITQVGASREIFVSSFNFKKEYTYYRGNEVKDDITESILMILSDKNYDARTYVIVGNKDHTSLKSIKRSELNSEIYKNPHSEPVFLALQNSLVRDNKTFFETYKKYSKTIFDEENIEVFISSKNTKVKTKINIYEYKLNGSQENAFVYLYCFSDDLSIATKFCQDEFSTLLKKYLIFHYGEYKSTIDDSVKLIDETYLSTKLNRSKARKSFYYVPNEITVSKAIELLDLELDKSKNLDIHFIITYYPSLLSAYSDKFYTKIVTNSLLLCFPTEIYEKDFKDVFKRYKVLSEKEREDKSKGKIKYPAYSHSEEIDYLLSYSPLSSTIADKVSDEDESNLLENIASLSIHSISERSLQNTGDPESNEVVSTSSEDKK